MTPREKAVVIAKTIGVVESPQAEYTTVSTEALLKLLERALTEVHLPAGGCNLDRVEETFIMQALIAVDWNQTRAARLLGISRDQIRYRMRRFRIPTNQKAG